MPTLLDNLNIATRDYIMGVDPSRDEKLRRDRIADMIAAGYDPGEAQAAVDVADAFDPPRRSNPLVDSIFQTYPLLSKLSTAYAGRQAAKAPRGQTITEPLTFDASKP